MLPTSDQPVNQTAVATQLPRSTDAIMSIEITLIQEIEKMPILYNYHLPEYNRKELVEESWQHVAERLNIRVNDAKEKWRNIRSSFLRSLKQTNKLKKPYYLSTFLEFLIPFLKATIDYSSLAKNSMDLSSIAQGENMDYGDQALTQEILLSSEIEIKQENIEIDNNVNNEDTDQYVSSTPAVNSKHSKRHIVRRRKRVPIISAIKYNSDLSRAKQKRHKPEKSMPLRNDSIRSMDNSPSNAMKYFLMSLVPEFDTMTEEQVRMFKIKVMVLIDDIKTSFEQLKSNSSKNNNQRLQKRLINLLLKNLEKDN